LHGANGLSTAAGRCCDLYIRPALVTCLELCCSPTPGIPVSGSALSGYSLARPGTRLRNVNAAAGPQRLQARLTPITRSLPTAHLPRSNSAEYLFCSSAGLIWLLASLLMRGGAAPSAPRPVRPSWAEPAESRARRGRNMSHTRRTASTGTAPARAASTWRGNLLQNVPLGPVAPTYIGTAPAPRCACFPLP
jgi:hypothetical protein